MSLLHSAMVPCIMQDRTTVADGYGGFATSWVDGAAFVAAIGLDTTPESRVADVQGVKGSYKVITFENVNLRYHDVFKRVSDGKIFRVVGDADDKITPASASERIRKVNAEEWRLAE